MYENDEKARAASTWKSDFQTHWGRHALNAIRALHEYMIRGDELFILAEEEA